MAVTRLGRIPVPVVMSELMVRGGIGSVIPGPLTPDLMFHRMVGLLPVVAVLLESMENLPAE